MNRKRRFPPEPRQVVLLLPAGGQLIGLMGFMEAFDAANRVLVHRGGCPLYRLQLVGVQGQTPSVSGPVLNTTPSQEVVVAHTLVVGGVLDERALQEALLTEFERLAATATRIVSVCMGAFVLGELGWLNKRRCTTHWLALDRLAARFPLALVEDDAIFTVDPPVWTSAGASAGVDLALQLIREDGGDELALAVARLLVVFARRPGGQSQFGSTLRLRPTMTDQLRELVAAVERDPASDHRVAALAARLGMSERNFARVFRSQTGQTPAAFVAQVRVEASKRALRSDVGIKQVSSDCGFSNVYTFRRTFKRLTGVTPSAWRARFSPKTPAGATVGRT